MAGTTVGKMIVDLLLNDEYTKPLEKAEQETKQFGDEAAKTAHKTDEFKKSTAELEKKLESVLEKVIKAVDQIGGKLVKALEKAEQDTKKLGDESVKAAKKTETLSKATADLNQRLAGVSQKAIDVADWFGGKLVNAAMAGTAAIAAFGAASVAVGGNFEAAMKKVAVLSDATDSELAALTKTARDLGATTQYSATEAAEAMSILAASGQSAGDVMATTGSVLFLAGAGATDLSTAAEAVTTSLSSFTLGAEDASHVADVFAMVTARSQFGIQDLNEAMKYAGPTASSFGMSIEETASALALFRDMGLQGSSSGTAFRSAMVQATRGTETTIAALEKAGLKLADINPEMHSFAEIMETVGRSSMSTTDIIEVFGTEAGGSVAKISKSFADGSQKFTAMVGDLKNSAGEAQRQYTEMTDTLLGRLSNLQSAGEEILLTVFDSYAGALKPFIDEVTNFLVAVGQEWGMRTGELSEGFEGVFGFLTTWLKENRTAFATAFVDFFDKLTQIAGVLVQIIPYLDEIGSLMLLAFGTVKVMQFASAIASLPALFGTATLSVEAFMGALTALTGGTFALVAGIGFLVAGLAALVVSYGEAAKAAEALDATERRIATQKQNWAADDRRWAQEALTRTREANVQKMAQLESEGKLTDELRRQLGAWQDVTEEQILAGDATGEIIEHNGELVRTADILNDLSNPKNAAAFETIKQKAESAGTGIESMKLQLAELMEQRLKAQDANDENWFFDADPGAVESYSAKIRALQDGIAEAEKRQQNLNGVIRKGNADLRVGGGGGKATGVTSVGEDRKNKLRAQDAEKTAQTVLAIEEKLQKSLATAAGDKVGAIRAETAARIAEAEKAYGALAAQAGGNAQQIAAIEARKNETIVEYERIAALEIEALNDAEVKKKEEQDARAADEALRQRRSLLEKLGALQGRHLTEVEKLERERDLLVLEAGEQNLDIVEKIKNAYAAMIKEVTNEEALANQERIAEGRMASAAIMQNWGTAAVDAAEMVAGAVEKAFGFIADMAGEAIGLFKQLGGLEVDFSLGGMIDAVMAAVKARGELADLLATPVGSGEGDQAARDEAIADLEKASRGLAEQVSDAISAAAAAIPQILGEIAADLPEVMRTVAAALPELATSLIDGLVNIAMAVVDALPDVLDSIVAKLPELMDKLSTALITVLQQVMENLPAILDGLGDAILVIIQKLLENLPTLIGQVGEGVALLVEKVAEILPQILQSIALALPGILQSLLKAVLAIASSVAQALPELMTSLMETVSSFLSAIMAFIPDLVYGIIAMIPQFIDAFIKELPNMLPAYVKLMLELVKLAVTLMPMIAIELIKAIIVEIIPKIPELTLAFIKALAEGMWEAAKAFAEAVGELLAEFFSFGLYQSKADKAKKAGKSTGSDARYMPGGGSTSMSSSTEDESGGAAGGRTSSGGSSSRTRPQSGGGGGNTTHLYLDVLAEGRVLESAILTAEDRGRATGIKRITRKSGGVSVAMKKSNYNPRG